MLRTTTAVFLSISLLSLGCRPESSSQTASPPDQVATVSKSTIAVIDLSRLADGIGATEKIRDAVHQAEQDLVRSLVQDNPDVAATDAVQSLTDFTALAREKIEDLPAEKKQALAEETQAAQALLLQRQLELREQFQKQVSTVAFEVARERGFDMVLTTAQVFATTADHDITAGVIERIKQRNAGTAGNSSTGQPAKPQSPAATTAKLPGGGNFPLR